MLLLTLFGVFGTACHHAEVSAKPANATKQDPDDGVTVLSPEDLARIDPAHADYLRYKLSDFGLVPLSEVSLGQSVERYRFLWLRSFRPPPIVFEIEFKADGSGVQRSRIWDDKSGWKTDKEIQLPKDAYQFYHTCVERWKLYDLPWYDDKGMLDGSIWLIELQRDGKYHALCRQSPESDDPVWGFGKMLIEDAIGGPYVPIN